MPAEPGVSCEACRFFHRGREYNQCRKNPPTHDPDDRVNGDFPGVREMWWCGEFEPAEPVKVDDILAAIARRILAGDTSGAMPLVDRLIELGVRG